MPVVYLLRMRPKNPRKYINSFIQIKIIALRQLKNWIVIYPFQIWQSVITSLWERPEDNILGFTYFTTIWWSWQNFRAWIIHVYSIAVSWILRGWSSILYSKRVESYKGTFTWLLHGHRPLAHLFSSGTVSHLTLVIRTVGEIYLKKIFSQHRKLLYKEKKIFFNWMSIKPEC